MRSSTALRLITTINSPMFYLHVIKKTFIKCWGFYTYDGDCTTLVAPTKHLKLTKSCVCACTTIKWLRRVHVPCLSSFGDCLCHD